MDSFLAVDFRPPGFSGAALRSMPVVMENEAKNGGFTYSFSLVLGLVGIVALGLLGLPMTTIILIAFVAAVLGAFLYGLWDILAHRRPRRSVTSRPRRRPRGRTLKPARRPAI